MSNAELNKALAEAQAEMSNPVFDSVNPHFRNKYASLASVRNSVLPVLAKHGLSLTQKPVVATDKAGVVTKLRHSSGEELDFGALLLPLAKVDAQGIGSAITYSRRYSLMAIAGVVGDTDDDGNEAVKQAPPTEVKQATPGTLKFGKQIATSSSLDDLLEVAAALQNEPDAVKAAHRQMFKEKQNQLEGKQ